MKSKILSVSQTYSINSCTQVGGRDPERVQEQRELSGSTEVLLQGAAVFDVTIKKVT